MKSAEKKQNESHALVLQKIWHQYGNMILWGGIFVMALLMVLRMQLEIPRLLWDTGFNGAIDLRGRFLEVQEWFSGTPVYGTIHSAVYPPASYLTLWPLLGWLKFDLARWLWAFSSLIMLGWLAFLTVRESNANTNLEKIFMLFIPLAIYPSAVTIGNGQLPVHIMPMLIAGLLLLKQNNLSWRKDLLAAGLFNMALVKPTVSAPFIWIFLFVPGRLRPTLFVILGYVALTLGASSFQNANPVQLMFDWYRSALLGVEWGVNSIQGGYSNLHGLPETLSIYSPSKEIISNTAVPTAVKLDSAVSRKPDPSAVRKVNLKPIEADTVHFNLPLNKSYISLLVLLALGIWICFYRRVDFWLLLGVTAVIARFWTYHMLYDDLLILLPVITLFRMIVNSTVISAKSVIAVILMTLTLLILLAPGSFYFMPPPWNTWYGITQMSIWSSVLIFLVICTHKNYQSI